MSLLFILAFAALSGAAGVNAEAAPPRDTPDAEHRPGAVIVGLRGGARAASVDALAAAGFTVEREIGGLGIYSVVAPVGREAETARALAQRPDVAFAELDWRASAQELAALTPNDPLYGDQWAPARIGAPAAWGVTTGSASVVIAVVDSGLDLKHPDLQGRLWTNAGEVPDNGLDDDGNGFVDDAHGWRFYHVYGGQGYEPRGDNQIGDDNGHGTHVAGVAGAASNNGLGIAGIAWNSPLMIVKVLDKTGYAWYSDVAAGISYAAKNGASVINVSLGGDKPSDELCAAVSAAVSRGKLIVAAAGNQAQQVFYPAACPGALAVGATDRYDDPAPFTNPGARVDLAAPGVQIISTWYKSGTGESAYGTSSGTSAAAPHVTGAVALIRARWPGLTVDGVKAQLQGSLVDVGAPGRDDLTGWGRLDLARALAAPVLPVDLRLDARTFPAQIVAGNPLTATFTVTNTGAAAATSVTLNASLPADAALDGFRTAAEDCAVSGTQMRCGAAALAPGAAVSFSVVMTPTIADTGVITTTASVSAAQRELTPGDNRRTVLTPIRPVLWGRVFLDGNGDGVRQPWETRGVENTLILLEQTSQPVGYVTSEGPAGAFHFDTLPAGDYSVIAADLPAGYQFTTPAQVNLAVLSDREQTVFFGAWTGEVVPPPARIWAPAVMGR